MFFGEKVVDYSIHIEPFRRANRSEGYTSVDVFKSDLPINALHKHLSGSKRWLCGRSLYGRIINYAKGRRNKKNRQYAINYHFRDTRLSLLTGLLLSPLNNKLYSLIFMSSGSVSYTPTSSTHELFRLLRFRPTLARSRRTGYGPLSKLMPVLQVFFLIHQLPKNKPVCLLEPAPGLGVTYARASGTKALLTKMDTRVGTSLVKLPSGVKKIFSIYGLGSLGTVALPVTKKMKNNKAGQLLTYGQKPRVRGVARNPVDHPHGGRTKTIQHPRTPWGKTTKLK